MDGRPTVYFDGACPLCAREIAFYRRIDRAERVLWHDVSADAGDLASCGLTQADALARLHVRTGDGRVVHGAAAFVEVWAHLPGFRVLAPVARLGPVLWLLERGYRAFLKVRPRLVRRLAA